MGEFVLVGIVTFSTELFCAKDALGNSVNVHIGAVLGKLTLPFLPQWRDKEDDPLHKPLLGPPAARNWKRGDTPIIWGWPCSYPNGDSLVERALLEFNVEPNDCRIRAQRIYRSFSDWLDLFHEYVVLLTRQNTRCRVSGGTGPGDLELLLQDSDGVKHIGKTDPETISIEMSSEDESLHLKQFEEASHFASLRLRPRLEYRLMLGAYRARRDADYRKALIEAATALEVCLTNRALEEFAKQGISFGKGLLEKFRTLNGRFELLRLLGVSLPSKSYKDLIVDPRNDVIHRADFPSKKLANQVIAEVEELLRLFSPQLHQPVGEN